MASWKCPYCGGNNSADDRSCPGCGCMRQGVPKPKRRGGVTYRQWQAIRPVPPQPTPDSTDIVKGTDPSPIIGAILVGLVVVYVLIVYFRWGF